MERKPDIIVGGHIWGQGAQLAAKRLLTKGRALIAAYEADPPAARSPSRQVTRVMTRRAAKRQASETRKAALKARRKR